jgi:hypothetical protein
MSERVKLKRITSYEYTTGDAQDWTYEYTWEDFEALDTCAKPDNDLAKLMQKIQRYFVKHPEKLLVDGVYKGKHFKNIESIQRWVERHKLWL